MLFLSCFCYGFVRICLLMPSGKLVGKGLTSWPLFVRSNCKFSLSHLYPWSVWCLIVSIPDLCRLSYFYNVHNKLSHPTHDSDPS